MPGSKSHNYIKWHQWNHQVLQDTCTCMENPWPSVVKLCAMWKQQPICASNWHRVLENITPAADLNAQLQY